ncbi:MAG TPA: DnaA N-terminal domain-containing protein, partial [Actinomycetota bacterium]|nr:DnaA N-terminal domain-containing protein [Actinomycetota bacterium]
MAVASDEQLAERTWSHVVERARSELPESSYAMWFSGVRATSLRDGVLEVLAPSTYVRDWLARHYLGLITAAAAEALGREVRVRLDADHHPRRPPAP